MARMRIWMLVVSCLLSGCGGALVASGETARGEESIAARSPEVEDLVRVRCATDGRDSFTVWRGSVFSFVPEERPRRLFAVLGMNVARCWRTSAGWFLASRELMLYLDPESGERLDRWTNPWTGAEVPVVHVANARVQSPLRGAPPLTRDGQEAVFRFEIPIAYPNPLASDESLQRYAPEATYRSLEIFGLAAPAHEVLDRSLPTVSAMRLTWQRVGPWLPWMEQGDRAGVLVYRANGSRVASLEELPEALRDVIEDRVPVYRRAPECRERGRNDTSWTYFARHRAAYEAGERFPVPQSAPETDCEADSPASASAGDERPPTR